MISFECVCSLRPRSEALFPPVLSWLMFAWINIEQEAILAQSVSGRQEVKPLSICLELGRSGSVAQTTLDADFRAYLLKLFIKFKSNVILYKH